MRHNWKQLILVQAGGVICLPVFIIGHALAKSYGFYSALLALVLGNFLLLAMGVVAAASSAMNKKSTAETAFEVFGVRGKKLFSAALVFSMTGWFAIQMNIMSSSFEPFVGQGFTLIFNILIGILITLSAIKGIKSLTTIATFSMPFLLLTIGYAIYAVSGNLDESYLDREVNFQGVSLVVACGIAAVIDLPTFFRLAKSKKDATVAALLLFGFVLPMAEGVGLYLFMQGQMMQGEEGNFVQLLSSLSPHLEWKIWLFSFLLLAGWTTNNANLYSAAVSLKTFSQQLSENQRILLVGFLGTVISCFNLLDHLAFTLDLIGILLASMGAVMVVHLVFREEAKENINLLAWGFGILGGIASSFGLSLLNIAVLDAFTVAFVAKLILKGVKNEIFITRRS